MMTNEEILLDRAKNNDAEAMFILGVNELFKNKNYEHSFSWFKKAYENGDNKAAFGLAITSFELNNNSKYYWGNVVLNKFGKNYIKEDKNYKLFILTSNKKNVEIGIGYEQNYQNIIMNHNDLMENKYIYNETIEEELSGLCLYSDEEKDYGDMKKFFSTHTLDDKLNPIVAIVKKNKSVLQHLYKFLTSSQSYCYTNGKLNIPVLIIDDEVDQASVDTKDSENIEGASAINRMIRTILDCLNRYSYVGYTATPFANVFVNPDREDIFCPPDDSWLGSIFYNGRCG